MNLSKSDIILTAWAEQARGPGWSNQLVWVLVYERETGKHRVESIQGRDFDDTLHTLFGVSCEIHRSMLAAVTARVRKCPA